MNFGKYAVLQPITYNFKREPELWWKFKPPTSGDELTMARFLNRGRLTLGEEGPSREVPPSWIEVAHKEISIIFAGTNITDDKDQPILADNASPEQVETMLRLMPHAMVMEIWDAIARHVPGWGNPMRPPDEDEVPNSESRETESEISL